MGVKVRASNFGDAAQVLRFFSVQSINQLHKRDPIDRE
jgi:hypothetical protein